MENNTVEVTEISPIVAQLNQSEIDTQITTAKRYPRSIKTFRMQATELATLDEETATECFYALPRGGKTIEGASARFAEMIMSCYGNCRAGARVIAEDGKFVTAQGAFIDLEKNIAITYETKRKITDKKGYRYSDDMIVVTANAACSIALRNAILKGVPKVFWSPIYKQVKKVAIGDVKTLTSRRDAMMAYFLKLGVLEEQVLELLGRESLQSVTLEDLAVLKGLATAIKEGDTTVEEVFLISKKENKKATLLNSKIQEKNKKE